jgi:hypothetical protein
MNRVYKLFLFSIGTVVATLFLGVLVPRTAHAVIATLVQVVNTPTSPVPTLDNSKSALFNVELFCVTTAANVPCAGIDSTGNNTGTFTVPAGQNLVITTFETTNTKVNPALINLDQPTSIREQWILAPGFQQLQYPTGIAIGPGSTLTVTDPTSSFFNARIHGYLTTQ